jgi:hypothetical protein
LNQGPEGKSVRRILRALYLLPLVSLLLRISKHIDVLEQLVGPNLYFHYSKINLSSHLGIHSRVAPPNLLPPLQH